ncbi:MAG: antibiotic biosynthesis monooxygenase [Clostridia bacterium]|nr:antibiotic biosynthesis monooxygenase [Clostridia bacterium]
MSLTVNLYYTGTGGNARKFAEEMLQSGIVDAVRAEEGNERYEYFYPAEDPETVLLIDRWRDQAALDLHHRSPMMAQIAALREKYKLHLRVERYTDAP